MKRILFLIAVVLGVSLAAQAQSSYSFTCDTYDQNGQCTYRNLHGVIKVTTDADGIYCLLAEVDKPAGKRGPLPFAFWTDPDSQYSISYSSVLQYDDSLHDVYYVTTGDEEFMVAVKYAGSSPSEIIMTYKWTDKNPTMAKISYSSAAYDGIYGVIKTAKRKIRFKTTNY